MCRCGLHRGHGHAGVWRMRGRGRAGVWQERTAQNSGQIFALDGAWGAKVGLDPPKTDAIFSLEEFFKPKTAAWCPHSPLVRLGLGSAASSTGPRYVIGEPLRLGRREGCLWIDLDERIVASQKFHVASQLVTAGGSRTIPEVQNFAKRRLRRTASDNSQSFFGMKWVIIPKNSSDLGHYFLPSPG